MSMALHASKILSELVPVYLKGNITRDELESLYEKTWKKYFSTRIAVGRIIQYSFGKEMVSNWMIRLLRPFPSIVGKLESFTHGDSF